MHSLYPFFLLFHSFFHDFFDCFSLSPLSLISSVCTSSSPFLCFFGKNHSFFSFSFFLSLKGGRFFLSFVEKQAAHKKTQSLCSFAAWFWSVGTKKTKKKVKERKRNNNSTPTNADYDDDDNKASELTQVRAKALSSGTVRMISTQTAIRKPKAGRVSALGLPVVASAFYLVLVDVAAKEGVGKKKRSKCE